MDKERAMLASPVLAVLGFFYWAISKTVCVSLAVNLTARSFGVTLATSASFAFVILTEHYAASEGRLIRLSQYTSLMAIGTVSLLGYYVLGLLKIPDIQRWMLLPAGIIGFVAFGVLLVRHLYKHVWR